MFHGKSFRTWDGTNLSTHIFSIEEGLQQGTVNSPTLFNIYTNRILKIFGLNTAVDRFGKAFADDFIAYLIGTNPVRLRDDLNELLNKINNVYQQWNLRVNPDKSESILFRRTTLKMNSIRRKLIADFQLQTEHPDTKELINVPHKNEVKYHGFHFDHLMTLNSHVIKQLDKAKNAFQANRRIFYS